MKSFFYTCLFLASQSAFAAGNETVKINADKTSGCSPLQVSFSAPGNGGSLKWDFGNGQKSEGATPSIMFIEPGVYKVKLSDNGAESVAEITVHPRPVAEFVSDKNKVCANELVSFTNQSTGASPIVNYVWAFGDGKTVNGSNVAATSHVYKTAGQYDVSLLVTDANGCMATKTAYSSIQAIAKPVADFKPSTTSACSETEEIYFTNLSTGDNKLEYSWAFGDKTTSSQLSPAHVFNQGKYDVALTVKDANGCSSQATKKISVTKLKAEFMSEKEQACSGEAIKFVNTSNFKGAKWAWEFGDGTVSTESNPSKAYASAGTYSVKFTVIDGDCKQTVSRESYITVRKGVSTNFTSNVSNNCNQPVSVKLENKTPNTALTLWNFGDGTVSTQSNPEKVYSQAGNYKVSLEVTDSSGCTIKKESEKVIHALKPLVGFKSDTFACTGSQVKFTNFTPNAASYLWNFGDGTTSNEKNPLHIFKKNGRYDITLTAFGDACDSTITLKEYVHVDTLKVDFEMTAATQTLVPPFLYSFKNKTNAANVKYMWDFGDGYTEASISPVHVYNTPGTFNVRLIAYAKNGCTNSKVITNSIQMGTSMGE